MMRNLKYTAAFVAAVLFAVLPVACTDDPAEPADPAEPTPHSGDLPVHLNVTGIVSPSDASRVMVGEDVTDETTHVTTTSPANFNHPDFYVKLKDVCAVPASGSREDRFAIGLFGDYTYTENGTKVTEYDFYRGDRLVYVSDEGHTVAYMGWDTNTAMKYWHPGAKYIFRAYYPQRLYNYTIRTSNATTLALTYPSRKLQYDLLLAVKEVTADADQMGKAVELKFQHALAALRFQFKLNFTDADLLTSVYLINDKEQTYFSQGTVIFGAEIDPKTDLTEDAINMKRQSIKWLQDYNPPSTEVLYMWVPPLKYWYGEGEDKNNDGRFDDKDNDGKLDKDDFVEKSADYMVAKWGWDKEKGKPKTGLVIPEGQDGVLDPIPRTSVSWDKFNPVLMYSYVEEPESTEGNISPQNTVYKSKYANSYYGTELYYDTTQEPNQWVIRTPEDAKNKEVDRFASEEADEVAAEGTLYCRNSGWLLIPPQQSHGGLTLCFTTKKGGETLYKVKLPVETGSKIDAMDEHGNLLTDGEGKPIQKDGWAAGKRYTYLVTISESDYTINVSIQDWNERKHSTEIIF